MNNAIIHIENLTKNYGDINALSNLSFDILPDEIFGFIGPDGAGKTTLFRIIASLLLPTKGTVIVDNHNAARDYKYIRNILGYMPGKFSLYQDLTVEENLKLFAALFGTTIKENYELIEGIYSSLARFKDRKAGNLSGGMKQKLALCCTLIHKPKILILDEPTTGVDPVSRTEFWKILKDLKMHGITIIVSTPYMDEASKCDRVAMIHKGEIMKIDTPENIVSSFNKPLWGAKSEKMYNLLMLMKSMDIIDLCYPSGEYLHFNFVNDAKQDNLNILKSEAENNNLSDVKIISLNPTIEDSFIKLSRV